jgi:hypothetical protein
MKQAKTSYLDTGGDQQPKARHTIAEGLYLLLRPENDLSCVYFNPLAHRGV